MSPSTRDNMNSNRLQASPQRFDLASISPKLDDNISISLSQSSPFRTIESDFPLQSSIEAIVEKNLSWLTYKPKFNYPWNCSKYFIFDSPLVFLI